MTEGNLGHTGPYGGNSIGVDTPAGESGNSTDRSLGGSYNSGVTQPGEL